jgi:hypothetical protein
MFGRRTQVAALLLFTVLGCGGQDAQQTNPCAPQMQLYPTGCGDTCPPGSFEAYRTGSYLVCNECDSDTGCDAGMTCIVGCGPGCEDDTAGCCPHQVCREE